MKSPAPAPPVHPGTEETIEDLLRTMCDRGASDLHVKVGSPPGLRVDGELMPLGDRGLRPEDTARLVAELLTLQQLERFRAEGDLDLSFSVPDLSRFRANVLTQRGSMGIVIRRIPTEIPTLESLGLPEVCRELADRPRGLVLVTGPTGAGKSTTLAAMLNHVNETRSGHILTVEDPIEFVHKDKNCWVTQREIGQDAKDMKTALWRALRQDPDVILVGEMRDLETIALAVTAAETGHLVFGSMHTTSATHTLNRIVDVFPLEQQLQVRMQLADTLQGIVSQCLLPRKGGRGRVAAHEVMVANDGVRALIREFKTGQIPNLIQTGTRDGMMSLETSLNQLVTNNQITYETATHRANFPGQVLPTPADMVRLGMQQARGAR